MASASLSSLAGRRERRRREIHERIIGAAMGLIARKGFATTTALEIAEAADVAEKTFYNHFATKQNLIQELALRATEETARRLEDARRLPGSTAARLRYFFESTADGALSGSREFVREVLLELVRTSGVNGSRYHLHHSFAAILEEGRARGEVSPDRDLEFLTEMMVVSYLGMIVNWVTIPDYPLRIRLSALADLVGEVITGKVAPQTGKAAR